MDFYVTVSSGPTKDFPDNETSWGEYYLEKPIELVGQYEVALVQSVFENIHSNNLGTINFFPSSTDMDMMTYKITANDGDSIEKIIQNTNSKIAEMASNYNYFKNNKELDQIPKIILDKDKSEFYFDLPENWQYFFTDLNGNHIYESYKYKNQTFYKFKNKNYFHLRHFYVLSNLIDNQVTGEKNFPLLSNFCLTEIKSNVVQADIKIPRYIKVSENTISKFSLEYKSEIYENIQLEGKIISTLHFRKINGL